MHKPIQYSPPFTYTTLLLFSNKKLFNIQQQMAGSSHSFKQNSLQYDQCLTKYKLLYWYFLPRSLQQYIFSVTKELEEQRNTFDVPKCHNENTNIFIFSDYGAYNYSTVSSIALQLHFILQQSAQMSICGLFWLVDLFVTCLFGWLVIWPIPLHLAMKHRLNTTSCETVKTERTFT